MIHEFHTTMKHAIILPLLFTAIALHAQHTHELVLENGVFNPEYLVVEAGDPIEVRLTQGHTITEVSPGTFRAGGLRSNGGVHIGAGTTHDGDHTVFHLDEPGDYYFVSEGRNGAVAKTHIVVLAAGNTGITPHPDRERPRIFPNPADDHVRFGGLEELDVLVVQVFDQGGRLVMQEVVRGGGPMNLMGLPSGHYTLRLTDGMSMVYGTERLVINRKGFGS